MKISAFLLISIGVQAVILTGAALSGALYAASFSAGIIAGSLGGLAVAIVAEQESQPQESQRAQAKA